MKLLKVATKTGREIKGEKVTSKKGRQKIEGKFLPGGEAQLGLRWH